MLHRLPLLLSAEELHHWLQQHPQTVVLDASWHMPNSQRNARMEYQQAHIPNARFFDLDAISDHASPLPHMLPPAQTWALSLGALGITTESPVIVYDTVGQFSAARCWWMFRAYGHRSISVLNGGLPAWQKAGFPVTSEPSPMHATTYHLSQHTPQYLVNMAQVEAALSHPEQCVLDARSPARFHGTEPDPRPGVRAGHMPGARNVHYATLLNEDKHLLPPHTLRKQFMQLGITPETQVVTTCGSGVTAAIIALALEYAGFPRYCLYDGSWAEWGSSGQPVQITPA